MAKKRRAGHKPPAQLGAHERTRAEDPRFAPLMPVIVPYTAACGRTDPHEAHTWTATFNYPAQCLGKKPKEGRGIAAILERIEQLPPAMPLDHLAKKPKNGVSRA